MKHGLLTLVFFGLSTLSATADDGVISGSDLSLLGLGEMQAMSDVEGMKIRGLSGSARSASSSSFVVTLVDPFSGSSLTQTGGQSSVASDENAGAVAAGAASASSATQASTTASTFVVVTGAAANTFNAAVSILTSTTLGAGRSQAAAVLVP